MNIGILGGTFDPIHNGHLAIAELVLKKFKLDRIEFIPCFKPPHRSKPIASPHDRLEMIKLATKNNPAFSVNEIEMQRDSESFTIVTVEALKKQFPENNYFYLIGADAFLQFDTWREWEKIISLTHIIIVSRNHYDITLPKKVAEFIEKKQLADHIHFCKIEPILISSTKIRSDLAAKKKNVSELADEVKEYIAKKSLY